MLPQKAAPGADQDAAPQTVRDTWKDLDVVIDIARSMKASVGLPEDAPVPDAVAQEVRAAVANVTNAARRLEQWKQGLGGDPSAVPPGPAARPPDVATTLQARPLLQETLG